MPIALTIWLFQCPHLRNHAQTQDSQISFSNQLSTLNLAIKTNPQASQNWVKRGELYADAQDFERAKADFARAINLDCKNADAFYKRGKMLFRGEEDYEGGAKDFAMAAGLSRDSTFKVRALRNQAKCQMSMRKYSDAIDNLTLAVKLKVELRDSLLERARCYVALKSYTNAIKDIDVIEMQKRLDDLALKVRADAEMGLGSYRQAIATLTLALERCGQKRFNAANLPLIDEREILYKLRSDAFSRLGEKKLADEDRKKATQLQQDALNFAPFR